MRYLITFVALLFGTSAFAQTDKSPSPAASAESSTPAKMRAMPFRGMIASVDEKTRAFTIAGKDSSHTVKITDKTLITKGGQAATMKDVVANEEARGAGYKTPDGSMEAKTLKLGPLTETEKAAKDARREKREAKKAAAASASTTP